MRKRGRNLARCGVISENIDGACKRLRERDRILKKDH